MPERHNIIIIIINTYKGGNWGIGELNNLVKVV